MVLRYRLLASVYLALIGINGMVDLQSLKLEVDRCNAQIFFLSSPTISASAIFPASTAA